MDPWLLYKFIPSNSYAMIYWRTQCMLTFVYDSSIYPSYPIFTQHTWLVTSTLGSSERLFALLVSMTSGSMVQCIGLHNKHSVALLLPGHPNPPILILPIQVEPFHTGMLSDFLEALGSSLVNLFPSCSLQLIIVCGFYSSMPVMLYPGHWRVLSHAWIFNMYFFTRETSLSPWLFPTMTSMLDIVTWVGTTKLGHPLQFDQPGWGP